MATNPFGFGPRGLSAPAAEDPGTKKARIDALALETQVPANILLAFDERGDDPAAKAKEISGWMAGGRRVDEVVPPDVMNRAYDIADALYPRHKSEVAETSAQEKPSVASDAAKQLGGSLVRGVGGMVDALGATAETLVTRGNAPDDGSETFLRSNARKWGELISGKGRDIQAGVSEETKQALAASTPGGDLLDPSTWTLGEAPSLRGYTMLAADVFGSFLPVVATAVITKSPAAAASVGGLQGGGAASQQARQTITDMAAAGALAKESAYFRELVAAGIPEAEAVERTARAAEQAAFLMTAPISAFGGAATGKIISPGIGVLAGKGVVARGLGTAAASAAEEGLQEVAESVATKAGINQGAGTDLSLTEGTFADFILGAMGGGPVGGVAGIFNKETRDDGSVAGQAGALDGIPPGSEAGAPVTKPQGVAAPGAEGGAAGLGQQPTPPAGPLSEIMAAAPDLTPVEAPAPKFPDFKPGKDVRLVDPETGVIHDAVFLSETPNGVTVRIEGGEVELDPATFDQARIAAIEADESATGKPGRAKKAKPAKDEWTGVQVETPTLPDVEDDKPYESPADAPAAALKEMGANDLTPVTPKVPSGPTRAKSVAPDLTPEEALKRARIIEDTAARGGWTGRLKKKHAEFMAIAGEAGDAQGAVGADVVGTGGKADGQGRAGDKGRGEGAAPVVADGRATPPGSDAGGQPGMVPDGGAANQVSAVAPRQPVSPITTPPDQRIQPDMLGGAPVTETEMARKERSRKEWGRFLAILENGKSSDDSMLEGRDVLIRGPRVIIRAKNGTGSDQDYRLNTEGMDRDTIAARVRGALNELDRRAPLATPTQARTEQVQAPAAAPPPQVAGAQDAIETDQVSIKAGDLDRGRVNLTRWEDGWRATFDYHIQGLSSGMGGVNGVFQTKEAAIKAGKEIVADGVRQVADGKSGSASAKNIAAAKRILKWAEGDVSEAKGPGKSDAGAAIATPQPGELAASSAPASTVDLATIQARLPDGYKVEVTRGGDRGQGRIVLHTPTVREIYSVTSDRANADTIVKIAQDEASDVVRRGKRDAPKAGLLSALSPEKQARAAELARKLADKARNQVSSGLDPEYITLGGELVKLYLEAGVRKFGQMLRDFAAQTGLTLKQAQEPMRAAYNHVRDNMEIEGESIDGMDDARAVLEEAKKAIQGDAPPPAPKPTRDPVSANPNPTGGTYRLENALTAAERRIIATARDEGAYVADVFAELDNAARRADADMRSRGMDINAADDVGNIDGKPDQMAWFIREAEAHTRELVKQVKAEGAENVGPLDKDEDTGEWEYDGSALGNALEFLDQQYAMGLGVDEDVIPGPGGGDVTPMDEAKVFPAPAKGGTRNIDALVERDGFVRKVDADARLAFWKQTAARIGREGKNADKVILSLFDYKGSWSQPWVDAGYTVIRHDIKTGSDLLRDQWIYDRITEIRADGKEVFGVLSACPCTTFTGSGARWWAERHDVESPEALAQVFGDMAVASGAKSALEYNVMLADATREAVRLANPTGFHVLENPIGRIQDKAKFPEPLARFHPHNFGDPYTKRTQLFGDFKADLPTANVQPVEGSKMQNKLRGSDPLGKEDRSTTPEGFAYAFFMANDPEARKVKDEPVEVALAPTRAEMAAAAKETDPNPTPAQAEAENYKTGKINWRGLTLSIENAKGSTRRKVTPDGKTAWEVKMPAHYGRILGTKGADGDHVDFYMASSPESDRVFVVDQKDADSGNFDEIKIILGARTPKEALNIYFKGFSDGRGKDRAEAISETSIDGIKQFLQSKNATGSFAGTKGAAWTMPAPTLQGLDERAGPVPEPQQSTLSQLRGPRDNGASPTDEFSAVSERGGRATDTSAPVGPGGQRSGIPAGQSSVADEEGTGAQYAQEPSSDSARRNEDADRVGGSDESGPVNDPLQAGSRDERGGRGADAGTDQRPVLKSTSPAANRAFPDFKGKLNGPYYDNRSEDGRFNEEKNAFHEAGLSFFRAAVKVLKDNGWTEAMPRAQRGQKVKPINPVSSNKAGPAVLGEVSITMMGPDGQNGIYARLGESFSGGNRAQMMWRINQATDPYGSGQNQFLDPTGMTPQEFAEKVIAAQERYAKKAEAPPASLVDAIKAAQIDAITAPEPDWWSELTGAGKAAVIREAQQMGRVGLSKSDKTLWRHFDAQERQALFTANAQINRKPAASVSIPSPATDQDTSKVSDADRITRRNQRAPWTLAGATKTTLTEDEAFEFGQAHFRQGYARLVPSEISMKHGHAASAWYRGWDKANVDEGVPSIPEPMVPVLIEGTATVEASDTMEPMEVQVTRTGPWDFNDTFPAPDADQVGRLVVEGRSPFDANSPDEVVSILTETMAEAEEHAAAAAAWSDEVDHITSGGTPRFKVPKGESAIDVANQNLATAQQALADTTGAVQDVWGEQAANAFKAEAERRVSRERTINRPAPGKALPTATPFTGLPGSDSQESAEPAKMRKKAAKRARDEQRGDQGSDQGQLDFGGGRGALDAEGRGDAEREGDGSGAGDQGGQGADAGPEQAGSLVGDPGRVSDRPVEPRAGEAPPNFIITDDFALGEGSDGQKLEANLAALRLVQTLESENRYATADEQAVLARWVGWGGLKTVFDEKHAGTTTQWGRAQAELKRLLTRTEYFDAMRSTADAHYTSRDVVKAMWQAMRKFGFNGGRALEPTIGSGNFLGLQPADMSAATEWYASELDPVTGRIAKHLYPRATVFDGMGFQDAPFRRASIDVAIGNPPFGGDASRVGNKELHPDLGRMKVHNFVIAKTGQLLREGGIMGMVVTHRFLDAMDAEARDVLAPNFHFLGAVRLPNTAFKANAGTEVTTDIVFFQKRRAGDDLGDQSWLEVGAKGPNGTTMNAWFANNPDMILGRPAMDGTMYAGGRRGEGEFTVHDDGRDLAEALMDAIGKIKASLPSREQQLEDAVTAPRSVSTLGYGEMMLDANGKIFRGDVGPDGGRVVEAITEETFWKDNAAAQSAFVQAMQPFAKGNRDLGIEATQAVRDAAVQVGLLDLAGDPVQASTKFEQAMADAIPAMLFGNPTKDHLAAFETYAKRVEAKRLGSDGFARLKAILDLRGRTKNLIRAEQNDDPAMEQIRGGLRQAYEAFRKSYGFLNNSKNEAILQGDVGPEMALEIKYKAASKDGRAETAQAAPILQKRVIFPHSIPERVDAVEDAIHISMQERGYLDPGLIARLTDKTTADVIEKLTGGDEPLAFMNPATNRYEMAETYLSGNLAEKIEKAVQARAFGHVPHLKKAMPAPKTQDQVTPSIRSMWIPREVFQDFMADMGYRGAVVSIMEKVGMVAVASNGYTPNEFGQQFSTNRKTAEDIFTHAIKGKIPVVFDTITVDGDKKLIKNEEATKEAVAAYERITTEFPNWAYANPMRAAKIVEAFNAKVNVVTPRKYDGVRYLRTVGTSPLVELRNSQKNGAWRMIQDRMVLLHHVVGAGKTMTGITGVMERKRMGLSRKAVVVVPNHLTGQWGKEWLELYPAANILVPTEKDFDPANRAKLINRIATGDFDAVIIGHSQLVKIDNDQEVVTRYIEDELDALNDALQEQKRSGESKRTISQIAGRIQKLRSKLSKLNDELADRRGAGLLSWKELGVDYMVLDESQEFKNLEYATTATQLVGMNDPNGSQKAFDLLMKIRSLQEVQNGGVTFMTGTPISNSLVEIYSVMKYLIPESLDAMGIKHFDAWKAAFIQDESRFEYTASMQLKERNVMSGMVNLGPLAELYRSFADIVMRPDVERMYREQMEAKNAANPDEKVSTRFPTPKVKGGKRRILLAPPTSRMEEFTRYLVMRMAGIKKAPDKKKYAKTDNPLWVLTDARKASVDIRTIDQTIGREEGSKVQRSADEIYRIWAANADRRGTQMVFSDMSTPSKVSVGIAKSMLRRAYELGGMPKSRIKDLVNSAAENKTFAKHWADAFGAVEERAFSEDTPEIARESLSNWMASDDVLEASAAMFTADTGFSFYDDLKAVLIEKGVPESEIAFIHDYDTTIKKKELFEAVNEGKVRILLGSTMKMGAGTNAQRRLVALHHIDAPWRPSDMEQREGRIIRQGNLFYEQDPEGFEVEILAYSTEKTSDVVQWQVLERKAKAIETFLNAATDTLKEEGSDADQYAEFMAQSTGKKVFLQKMQVEKDLVRAKGAISNALRARAEARRFVDSYETELRRLTERATAFSGVSKDIFPADASNYMAEWQGLIGAYRVERDRIEKENEEIRKRNVGKARKDWERILPDPNAPKRWQERPTNEWESKVYDALQRAAANPMAGPHIIKLGGGYTIEVHTSTAGDGSGVTTFAAYLASPGVKNAEITLTPGFGVAAKDFRNSDKLLASFDPANITYWKEHRGAEYSRMIETHKASLPEMQAVLEKRVDEGKVRDLTAQLASLSAEARIEEVKYAEETANAGSNHFAEIDTKGRILDAGNDEKPITGQFQFQNAGRSYASEWGAPAGRRRIEGTDKWGDVAYFEATDMDNGEAVIVEALKEPKAKPEEPDIWKAVAVFAYAEDGGLEMRDTPAGWGDVEADPEITEADIMAITRDLNAEMERTGLAGKVNVRVVRELYSRVSGSPIMGRADSTGITVKAGTQVGDIGVMRHEIIHALRSEALWNRKGGLFTEAEWSALVAAARAEPEIVASVKERYSHLDKPAQVEEMVAELYRLWMDNRDGYSGIERAMLKVEGFLTALANLLRGRGFVSAARVMEQIATGKIGGRGPQGPGGGRGIRLGSKKSHTEMRGSAVRYDNPGGSWLAGKVERAEEAMRKAPKWSAAYRGITGPATAYTTAPVSLPVDFVAGLPGASGEKRGPGDPQYDALADAVRREGWRGDDSPILIEVNHKGQAFITEGNTRAAIAQVNGIQTIKAEVKWLNGGEAAQGALTPARLESMVGGAEMRGGALPGAIRSKFKGLIGSRHWKNPGEFASNALTDAMAGKGDYSALALVPGRALFAELGKRLPSAKVYLRTKEDMDELRNSWHAKADEVAQEWRKARRADPRANDDLMDLMHRSTLSGVDPSRPDTWKHAMMAPALDAVSRMGDKAPLWAQDTLRQIADHEKAYAALAEKFNALPKEMQDIYRKTRAAYDKMGDDFEKAVLDNIKTSMKVAVKRAEKAHRKEMERIRDEGLEGQERDDAIQEADERLAAVKKRGGWAAQAKVNALRKKFESNRLKGPYFPLARFGQFFVTIRNHNGEVVSFSRFEREAQQQAFIREQKEAGAVSIQHGVLSDSAKLKAQIDPTFVADIEMMLADSGASNDVMDAIWQRYLETMPDQSIRTSKIHRKGREGWSSDAFRAFGHHMFHGAHQLARLNYGLTLEEALNDAEDEAKVSEDPNRAGLIVNEMRRRHAFTMNPMGSSLVAGASSLSFIWYLAATPAAAIANISQTTVMGPGIMAARFKGAGVSGAISEIGKAMKDFAAGHGDVQKSPRITQDEHAAITEAYRRGTIDKTQAHDLASVAETGIEYNATREAFMRKIGWLFHHAERMNREVTFLANYRLARAEGLRGDDAIDAAADLTWKIHFDYQNTSRPRFMQNDLGKLLTIFRQFSVNVLWRLFRDTHQSLRGATPEERAEARTQLIGITLSMMAHAGIKGTWGYGLIMALLAIFFPGDSDDIEEWMHDALLMEGDSIGVAAWNYAMGAALNGVPGQITGTDLSERVGSPNLWFRGAPADLEGEDVVLHYVTELLGPPLGIAMGIGRGVQLVTDGEVYRGVETAVPKAIRDVMKAGRYAAEGVETLKGDDILENVNPWELLMQANGFVPARVAERFDINSRLKTKEREITDERKGIHKGAVDAILAGEPIPADVMDQIRDFNRRFPEYPITSDTIRQSAQGRMRAQTNADHGITLNPRISDRLREDLAPAIYE